jgi:hypothetical protein
MKQKTIISNLQTRYAISCVVNFYNDGVVKIYSATNGMARLEKKFLGRKNALAYGNAGAVAVNLKFVGLAPGLRHG